MSRTVTGVYNSVYVKRCVVSCSCVQRGQSFPVSDVIHRFGLLHYSYADDTKIYITIKRCFADKLSDIQQCVSEIKVWMNYNMFKLHDDNKR